MAGKSVWNALAVVDKPKLTNAGALLTFPHLERMTSLTVSSEYSLYALDVKHPYPVHAGACL